jgi:hypothetical protein
MTTELIQIIILNALEPTILCDSPITHDNKEFVAYEVFKTLLDGFQTDHIFNSNETELVDHMEIVLSELDKRTSEPEIIDKLQAELHARFRAE